MRRLKAARHSKTSCPSHASERSRASPSTAPGRAFCGVKMKKSKTQSPRAKKTAPPTTVKTPVTFQFIRRDSFSVEAFADHEKISSGGKDGIAEA